MSAIAHMKRLGADWMERHHKNSAFKLEFTECRCSGRWSQSVSACCSAPFWGAGTTAWSRWRSSRVCEGSEPSGSSQMWRTRQPECVWHLEGILYLSPEKLNEVQMRWRWDWNIFKIPTRVQLPEPRPQAEDYAKLGHPAVKSAHCFQSVSCWSHNFFKKKNFNKTASPDCNRKRAVHASLFIFCPGQQGLPCWSCQYFILTLISIHKISTPRGKCQWALLLFRAISSNALFVFAMRCVCILRDTSIYTADREVVSEDDLQAACLPAVKHSRANPNIWEESFSTLRRRWV